MRRGGVLILCAVVGWGLSGCFDTGPAGPICGAILYKEPFDGSGSGWPQASDADAETSIHDGRYRIEVLNAFSYVYLRNDEQGPYTDLCYAARVWDRSNEAGQSTGLAFRWTDDGRFYLFSISPDSGMVVFAIFTDGRARAIRATNCSAIRGVGEENRIRVIAQGDHFLFFVNDELAFDEYDSRLVAGGIGVSGASWETIPAVLEFDDLTVRRPE
jgi:hypothetical protein